MSEAADLLAAITAAPADDLPRLVFADWLEDRGETDYAQFVRDQIRLSQVPQWDPLAVRARHQLKNTLGIGKPFFGTLPELPIFLKWHPEKAFRRGFGSGVVVNQLSGLLEAGPQLFDVAPVDELWLSAASLDEWRLFAKSPWLQNVRKLHFHFSQGLHEPIRCLAESKYAGNIDEIWFDTLATPAAGTVIEALAESPLAKQLTGLHMRLVHTPSIIDVNNALMGREFELIRRFSMSNSPTDIFLIDDFFLCPILNNSQELTFDSTTFSFGTTNRLYDIFNRLQNIECVSFHNTSFSVERAGDKFENIWTSRLKYFNIGRLLESKTTRIMMLKSLYNSDNIRSLILSSIKHRPSDIISFFESPAFSRLTEFDISNCTISSTVIKWLLKHNAFDQLAALIVSKNYLPIQYHKQLESHFGDRLVWAEDETATGLSR